MKRLLGLLCALLFSIPAMSAGLPSGYTELQWIEKKQGATGYIDTNVPQGDNVGIKVNVKFSTYVSGYQYVAGAFTQGSYIGIWKDSADVIKFCHVNTIRGVSNTNTTDFQVIENNYLNSRKYRINGTDKGNIAETTSVTSPTIYIFNTHYGTRFNGGFLLAGAEITVGGEVVRNFVPVKRDSDNRLGMYDTVNDKFYAITDYENFVAGESVNPCKNLFNKYDSDVGDGYIAASTGAIVGNSGRSHTGYILVKPNTTYHVTLPEYQQGSANGIAFYTANKTFVSGIASSQSYGREPYNFTVPNDDTIVYARLTITNIIAETDLDAIQIEEGDHGTSYVPYDTMCWCKNLAEPKFAGMQVTGWNGINIKSAGTYSVKLIRKDDWTPPAKSYVGLGSVNPGLDPSLPQSWTLKGGWLISNGTISKTFVSAELPGTHQLLGVTGIDQTTFFQHFDVMLVSGSYTASSMPSYEPYNSACFGIKIATTKYNTNAFSSVVTALSNAVDTIKTVVANTINQATAVANLQSGKQTKPTDTCPSGKTCLLVEDANGNPHWYEIVESYYNPTLPSGFTELAYLQSDGNQWIDTGYAKYATGNIYRLASKVSWADVQTRQLQGCQDMFYYGVNSGYFQVAQAGVINTTTAAQANTVYEIDATFNAVNDTATYSVNGIQYTVPQVGGTAQTMGYLTAHDGENFGVFSLNNNTLPFGTAKVYYYKLYRNGTLVRDMIPARRESDGVLGMYDLVNNQFYTNAGSGTFTAGPVVLPAGYTTLEYIQSSGTQYIDTGLKIKSTQTIKIKMAVNEVGSTGWIGAITTASNVARIGQTSSILYCQRPATGGANISADTNFHTYVMSPTQNAIDNTTLGTTVSEDSTINFLLFAQNDARTNNISSHLSGKISEFQVMENGTLIQNLVPAKNASNVVGMYDTVSGQFYTNAGTGTFTAGPVAQ